MKLCLVTVGATASFKGLVQEVLSGPFLAQLQRYKFTDLAVQYGKDARHIFDTFRNENPEGSEALHGISVAGFEFVPDMSPIIKMVRKDDAIGQEQGMIISHAGRKHLRVSLNILILKLNCH